MRPIFHREDYNRLMQEWHATLHIFTEQTRVAREIEDRHEGMTRGRVWSTPPAGQPYVLRSHGDEILLTIVDLRARLKLLEAAIKKAPASARPL